MTRKLYLDALMDQLEAILDYYADSHHRPKDTKRMLLSGSSILEGLVSEDPFIVNKAINAAKLYIAMFNKSGEMH